MENVGVEQGIWKVEQNVNTKQVSLLKYNRVVEEWQGDRLYAWNELYDILLRKSYEKRSEK